MLPGKSFIYLLSFLCASFLFMNIEMIAQHNDTGKLFGVKAIVIPSDNNLSETEMLVLNSFNAALKEKNILAENQKEMKAELWLNVKAINDSDAGRIAVSVIILDVIPAEVAAIGAEKEIFFAQLDDERRMKLPAEGKSIREFISSEYMKQFRMLLNTRLEIINLSEIDEFSADIVEKYLTGFIN